jgi:hypothetical protein
MIVEQAQQRLAEVLDIAEEERIDHPQPLRQHLVPDLRGHPGREVVRVRARHQRPSQEHAVGVVVDALRRGLLDLFHQLALVPGAPPQDLAKLDAAGEGKRARGMGCVGIAHGWGKLQWPRQQICAFTALRIQ